MIRSDRISSVFFIGLSLFICQQSVDIGLGTPGFPGPGALSFGAGAVIGIIALLRLIQSFFSKEPLDKVRRDEAFRWSKFLLIISCVFGYAIVIHWLGFILSSFILVSLLLLILESQKWWLVVIKAALISMVSHLFFVEWLGLMPPKGFLGW